jgi:hypothetical protein
MSAIEIPSLSIPSPTNLIHTVKVVLTTFVVLFAIIGLQAVRTGHPIVSFVHQAPTAAVQPAPAPTAAGGSAARGK